MGVRFEVASSDEDGVVYPILAHKQEKEGQTTMVDPHYHEYIEILYCLDGSFDTILDGKEYVFSKGDMVVVNSMEVHSVCTLDNELNSYIVIRFNPEVLYTTAQTIFEAKYVLPFTMKNANHQRVFYAHEIGATNIPSLIKSILSEYNNRHYGYELAIRTSIGEIFLWILRSWHNKGLDLGLKSGLNSETIERLQKVFDYVDNNYSEPISTEEMSKLCGMSYSYFSRFFKKMMGKNFSEYVNLVRVSKAEHILASTDMPITEVALEVGFSTSSYFIEQFKSFKSITPKQFRIKFLRTV